MHRFQATNQVQVVNSFEELVNNPFQGQVNVLSWERSFGGNFKEIIRLIQNDAPMIKVEIEQLLALDLSPEGELARTRIITDMELFKSVGADPLLNLLTHYERDDENPYFSTDVYSWHVDASPIPTYTYLCTYAGATSEFLPNHLCVPKVQLPEIQQRILADYKGKPEQYAEYLHANFLDLHYEALPFAEPCVMNKGQVYRLAVKHPDCPVPPCIHRAPIEKPGESRLLLIC